MSLKDFEIGKELGKGAFGAVAIVKRIADGETYAMKRVKISQLGTKERENALNEVRILASLSHTNIIGYKEAFFDEESKTLNIVMEIADDGDLESQIQKNIKMRTNFQEGDLWSYLTQIMSGLKYLHDNNIMHRDLKCANIFLLKNGTLKLGDLNVSKIVKMGLATTQTGTPYYASPEVWADKPYNYKSDIWSAACVLYELCALRPPFRGSSLEQLYKNVMKGVYEQIPSIYSKDMSTVISLMLQVNPINRPTCDQLLNNPILVKRICDIVEGKEVLSEPGPIQLLKTIKLPRNMNEINQRLPKKKRYKEEMEAVNLMNYDVSANSKKPAEVSKKENEDKENVLHNMKRNKELDYINYNLNHNRDLIGKEREKMNQINYANQNNNHVKDVNLVNNNYNQVMQQKNQQNRVANNNNYNLNNNNIINYRKDNAQVPVSIRPSSVRNEVLMNKQYQVYNHPNNQQPRTPIGNKNENINKIPNKENIYQQQNKINPYNYNNILNNNKVFNIIPSQKNNILNREAGKIGKEDKSKPISSHARPQSAKVGGNVNDIHNRINPVNNQQLLRKNYGIDRPSSPGKILMINKRPISNNSPRNKSPIGDRINHNPNNNIYNNVIPRPQSGKDRVNLINNVNLNNNIIHRNDKKVVIEKINYERGMQYNPIKLSDPKKQNYHYNQNYREQILVNNKINVPNAVRVNSENRGVISHQMGPKIVYINPRK